MATSSYRDLKVWKSSVDLAVLVYRSTESFPAAERFGLTIQLRRAAVSVPSNIAEGQSRKSARDFLRFLHIAEGSLAEIETQLEIARQLNWINEQPLHSLLNECQEIGKMLNGLTRAIHNKLR